MTWLDEQRALIERRIDEVSEKMNAGEGPLAIRILMAARVVAEEAPKGLRVMILDTGISEALFALRAKE